MAMAMGPPVKMTMAVTQWNIRGRRACEGSYWEPPRWTSYKNKAEESRQKTTKSFQKIQSSHTWHSKKHRSICPHSAAEASRPSNQCFEECSRKDGFDIYITESKRISSISDE
jgi:hypothetical protein